MQMKGRKTYEGKYLYWIVFETEAERKLYAQRVETRANELFHDLHVSKLLDDIFITRCKPTTNDVFGQHVTFIDMEEVPTVMDVLFKLTGETVSA